MVQERKDHSLMEHADVSYHQSLLGTSSRLAWTYVWYASAAPAAAQRSLQAVAQLAF
jgi:hypothetical protein